jgi:hypothetical protein
VAPSVADRRLGLQPVATQRGVDGGPLGRLSGGRGGRGGVAHRRIEAVGRERNQESAEP